MHLSFTKSSDCDWFPSYSKFWVNSLLIVFTWVAFVCFHKGSLCSFPQYSWVLQADNYVNCNEYFSFFNTYTFMHFFLSCCIELKLPQQCLVTMAITTIIILLLTLLGKSKVLPLNTILANGLKRIFLFLLNKSIFISGLFRFFSTNIRKWCF